MSETKKVKVQKIPAAFQNGFLVNLRIRKWGATAKADEALPDDFPKEIYKAVQDLLDESGRAMLDKLNYIKGQAHRVINENSIYHPIPGFRFLPGSSMDRIEEVAAKIETFDKEYFAAANDFVDRLEELKQVYASKYPKHYNSDKYPTADQVRRTFKFEFQIFEFKGPSEDLKKISQTVYDQQMAETKKTINEMCDYVKRIVASELVERMKVLQDQCADGKVNSATIQSVNNLLGKFDSLYGGFVDNKKIKDYVADLKEYMDGTDADLLRASDDFRGMVANKAKEIGNGIQNMPDIKGKLKRSFDF